MIACVSSDLAGAVADDAQLGLDPDRAAVAADAAGRCRSRRRPRGRGCAWRAGPAGPRGGRGRRRRGRPAPRARSRAPGGEAGETETTRPSGPCSVRRCRARSRPARASAPRRRCARCSASVALGAAAPELASAALPAHRVQAQPGERDAGEQQPQRDAAPGCPSWPMRGEGDERREDAAGGDEAAPASRQPARRLRGHAASYRPLAPGP